MLNKKVMLLVIFLVSLLALSVVSATENNITSDNVSANDDVIGVESTNNGISSDINLYESTDNLSIEENNVNKNLIHEQLSNDDNDVLGASPPYSKYSVYVSDTKMDYGTSKSITISISSVTGYDYKYDFYFRVYDSDGNQKINQRYYSTISRSSITHTIGSTTLEPGVYTIKLVNYADSHVMDTATLDVRSVPASAYSVSVSDMIIDYGYSASIPISISPASDYYDYKYDFYFKVYDSKGNEKISKRYFSSYSSSKVSYQIGSNDLEYGVYTIKILNNYDDKLMSTCKLTIQSPFPPASAYSVNVFDTLLDSDEEGVIKMSITPAYSYTYKYDFYLKVYNPSGSEKISKRIYTQGYYYTETYNVNPKTFSPGIYTIMIRNSADDKIMSTAKLTVTKLTLETQNVTGNCNEIIEFKVRAAENNVYKSDLNITVLCNDEEYHITTDNDGNASLKIHLKANTYNVRTIFQNNVKENTIVINPVYVANVYKDVYVKSFIGYYNGNNKINYGWKGNLEGYFKIYKGNKIVYQTKFNSNGNIYDYFTYITYDNQYSGVSIKKIGIYNSVITDVHGNILAKATIKIKKASPKLSIVKKTFNVKLKTKKVKITLKDSNGAIKKAKLTLKIKGKFYKSKTNKKGVAIFKVKKITKVGKYKVIVKFKGNKNYNKISKKFKISVKKIKKYSNKKKTTKKTSTNKKSSGTYKFNVPRANAEVTVKVFTGKKYNTYTTQTNWLGNGEVYVTETSGVEHKVLLEVHYYDNGFKTATYEGMSFFLR